MKKQLLFLIIAASAVLFACESSTEVTISNQSSVTLYDVTWNGCRFYSTSSLNYIGPGDTDTRTGNGSGLKSGSGYVFFKLSNSYSAPQYRSLKKLAVGTGNKVTFYITNDTVEAKQQ
jgi:hypothetical protein